MTAKKIVAPPAAPRSTAKLAAKPAAKPAAPAKTLTAKASVKAVEDPKAKKGAKGKAGPVGKKENVRDEHFVDIEAEEVDVEGEAASLGKTAGKDARGDKPTYPALFGLEMSRTMAGDCRARARAALEASALADSWLPEIADWVVTRKN